MLVYFVSGSLPWHGLESCIREMLVAGSLGPVRLAKLERGYHGLSRANHFAGTNTDEGKSLAVISTPLSGCTCGTVLQTLNASLVEMLVMVVACAANVVATTSESR